MSESSSCDRVMDILNKKHGAGTVIRGDGMNKQVPRLTTGVFSLTFASGGGYPLWRFTRIKGPFSGGKSTTCLSAMKMAEMTCWRCMNIREYCRCKDGPKEMRSVYLDIEGAFDPNWAEIIGVSPDHYYLPRASDGGEYLDAAATFLMAEDCGLIIIDSVAMLVPKVELERGIGDDQVGSLPKLLSSAFRKLNDRVIKECSKRHPCLVIFTNQVRAEIGSFYGGETEGGGNCLRHTISLGVRMTKLSTKEEKYHDKERGVDAAQRHGFWIDKYRIGINTKEGEFVRAKEDIPNTKNPDDGPSALAGEVLDLKPVYNAGKQWGLISKLDDGYYVSRVKEPFSTANDVLIRLRDDSPLFYQLQKDIAETAFSYYHRDR